jgi:hypothetical protein
MKGIFTVLLALSISAAAVAKDNLAILPFSGGAEGEGETIAELFSFEGALTSAFNPVPRTSINRAIRSEQSFQMGSGMTDPETIAALGRQLGAQYVVSGSITALGSQRLLVISILKIDELRQIGGDVQTYGEIEEIRGKLSVMARTIVEAAAIDASRLPRLSIVPVELGGGADRREADTLAQILAAHIVRSGKYAVYPRTASLEQVQAEYTNQFNGDTADENLPEAGRGANPELVLSVTARKLGAATMFNAAVINLVTGVQEAGNSADYRVLEDGLQAMETLALRLTGGAVSANAGNATGSGLADSAQGGGAQTGSAQAGPGVPAGIQAAPINLGAAVNGTFRSSSDVHWYSLNVPAGAGSLTVYTEGSLDVKIALYNSQQVLIAEDDDSGASLNARVSLSVTAPQGTAYIRVQEYGGETGSYTLHTQMSPIVPLSLGATVNGSFRFFSDVHWYSLNVPAGGSLAVTTGGGADSMVSLYNSQGDFIAGDDDSGGFYTASLSAAVTAGVAYIKVEQASDLGNGSLYTLHTQMGGNAVPNNQSIPGNQVVPIALGGSVNGTFRSSSDVHWYSLTIPSGGGGFTAFTEGSRDTKIAVYNSQQALIAEDDDSGADYNARVSAAVSQGTIYLKVEEYDGNTGSYTLRTQINSIVSLTLGATVNGTFRTPSDVHWYSLNLRTGGDLTITTGGGADSMVTLYNSQWDFIAEDDDSGGALTARLSAAVAGGVVYLRVQQASEYGSGSRYTLSTQLR